MISRAFVDFYRFNLIPLLAIVNIQGDDIEDSQADGDLYASMIYVKWFISITSIYPIMLVLICLRILIVFGMQKPL
jgi:hypothetical protein